jgi:hypothetical protein
MGAPTSISSERKATPAKWDRKSLTSSPETSPQKGQKLHPPIKELLEGITILECSTTHMRTHPKSHVFHYPALYFAIDLKTLRLYGDTPRDPTKRLEWIRNGFPLFGYNRAALYSIWDEDYLNETAQLVSIEEKIHRYLIQQVQRSSLFPIELASKSHRVMDDGYLGAKKG